MSYRCHCGRFLANVIGTFQDDWLGGYLSKVEGDCRQHGHVKEASGEWSADDFPTPEDEVRKSAPQRTFVDDYGYGPDWVPPTDAVLDWEQES